MNLDSIIETSLRGLLDALGVQYSDVVKSEIAGQNVFSIRTEDARPLIGGRGEAIQALDILVKKIVEKKAFTDKRESTEDEASVRDMFHFLIDVNDYRAKQIKDLQSKALMMAERARSFQYDVELSPMSSYERLIIHTTLSGAPNIKTESQGEGRGRRVVIKYQAG